MRNRHRGNIGLNRKTKLFIEDKDYGRLLVTFVPTITHPKLNPLKAGENI
jgi:hypothetical protein